MGNWEGGKVFGISICCGQVPKKRLLPMAISFNVRWRFGNKIAEMAWISRLPGRPKKIEGGHLVPASAAGTWRTMKIVHNEHTTGPR